MKLVSSAPLLLLACIVGIAIAFVVGQRVGVNDSRLFAEDDSQRTKLIARSCGKSGELMQAAETKQYLCVWRNRDGQAMVADVPGHPYLEHLAQR